jgi:predicted permease
MRWFDAARARLRLIFARRVAEKRTEEEFRFHIDMETERLVREAGLDPREARRRALIAFGGVEQHKEALREGRGLAWLGGLSLDLKLGLRMLAKYPGLTVVGGLAMAFAICVSVLIFEIATSVLKPTLPLPAGERVVQIRNWDVATDRPEQRLLHDFVAWRGARRSVTELGAWRDVTRTLIVAGDESRPVQVAEITASGFRVAGAVPLLGRVLDVADERPNAPLVAVLGYDVWRIRFGSDPDVIGRAVQLGGEQATVVGVMREGFGFPVSHELWTPLETDVADLAPRSGPSLRVFGVLTPDASLEAAQAEMTMLGRRAAVELPATHEYLQARVELYTKAFSDPLAGEFGLLLSIYFFAAMLLVLVCGNVALLLFARAATRENELVVRSALGASRTRIVVQMFAEALVLGGAATLVSLAAAHVLLRSTAVDFLEAYEGQLPFWVDLSLSPTAVLFALGLTVVGSAIAGVLPALKVTRSMGSRLRQAASGAGGLQFGGVWTAVIVAQIAVTVAFPVITYVQLWGVRHVQTFEAGFADEEYLTVQIEREAPIVRGANADSARLEQRPSFASTLDDLRRRVAAEPGVVGVTFVDRLPRTGHSDYDIELYDASADSDQAARGGGPDSRPPLREVRVAYIDPSYFEVLEAPILAGRAFHAGDLVPGGRVAIVDQGFVDQVLQGRNAIGQQVRFVDEDFPGVDDPEPWFEVVGVVRELGVGSPSQRGRAAGFYLPTTPDRLDQPYMMIHVRGDPMTLVPRLREVAAAVDPTPGLSEFQRAEEVLNDELWVAGLWLRATVLMSAIALLLSLAGIYAVLAFTVSRRTREIGVRVALGAGRPRIFSEIFRRPLSRVGIGILAGSALIAVGGAMAPGTDFSWAEGLSSGPSLKQVAMLLAYATLMLGVCLLACVVPTRRALNVEPTIALRMD